MVVGVFIERQVAQLSIGSGTIAARVKVYFEYGGGLGIELSWRAGMKNV